MKKTWSWGEEGEGLAGWNETRVMEMKRPESRDDRHDWSCHAWNESRQRMIDDAQKARCASLAFLWWRMVWALWVWNKRLVCDTTPNGACERFECCTDNVPCLGWTGKEIRKGHRYAGWESFSLGGCYCHLISLRLLNGYLVKRFCGMWLSFGFCLFVF